MIMVVWNSFASGIRNVWGSRFLVGMMFAFKLVSSLVLLFPLYLMLSASFARNVRAEGFLAGMDLSIIIDFVYHWREALGVYLVAFFALSFLLILVFVFLSGGFWGMLQDRIVGSKPNSKMERFFGYSGKYFWGMIKVSLLVAVLYFVSLVVFIMLDSFLTAVSGRPILWDVASWRTLIRLGLAVILFCLVNMTGDYLKISLVHNYGQRFSTVIRRAMRFLLTNPAGSLSLYYLLSVILAASVMVFVVVRNNLGGLSDAGFFVFVVFLVQQVFVLFCSFYRLVYYSAQLVFYEQRTRLHLENS
jgi:hypothetical protein